MSLSMAIMDWMNRVRRKTSGGLPTIKLGSRVPMMSLIRRYGVREEENTTTDLYAAVAFGELAIVSHLLILPGTDPSTPGQDGRTPLQIAIEYGHLEIVKLLLRMPTVNPHGVIDEVHRTPLHIACWKGQSAIIELLLATRPKKETIHIPASDDSEPTELFDDSSSTDLSELEPGNSNDISFNDSFQTPLRARMSSITLIGQRLFGINPSIDATIEEVETPTLDSPTLPHLSIPHEPLPYVDINAKAKEKFEELKYWKQEDMLNKREWLTKGFTPLHLAAWKGNDECIKLLLEEKDIDLDVETIDGFTPLHMAADRGNEEVIHLILQEYVNRKHERQMAFDINLFTERDMTYMNHERDQRMLKFQILATDANGNGPINTTDCMGRTPLHYAAREGRTLTVKELLLWNDTYVNMPDVNGMLPIHMAAREGHAEIVALLLYEYHWGPTILKSHKQGMVTKPIIVRPLPVFKGTVLEILPRPDLSDAFDTIIEGSSPLHVAAIRGHIQVVLKLLKYVDPTVFNGKKQTALDVVLQQLITKKWANSFHLIEIFKLLLVAMPKVTIMSDSDIRLVETLRLDRNSGRESLLWKLDVFHATTLMHWAAAKGSTYLVQLLLYQPGIDINQVSSEFEKFTPLHMAAKAGHTGVIRLLVAEKDKLHANEEDYLGRTALQIAAERNFASKHGGRGLRKLREGVFKKNPLEGIIEISWRDCEQLLLGREDVKGYVDLLYRDRQVFVDAANAILVGSALIATVTYNGWMTPPLGYIPYYHLHWELPDPAPLDTFPNYVAIEQYSSVRAFWIFNSLSFFFSMASVIASAEGILPVQGKFIKEAVQDARKAVAYASSLLVISVVFALGSFSASGYAVLPPIKKWENYMTITICFGGLVTLAFTVRFVLPVSRMLRPKYSTQIRRGKFQRFQWS